MTQPDPSELSHDALQRELTATRRELDRANAEIARLRAGLIDLQQLMRSK